MSNEGLEILQFSFILQVSHLSLSRLMESEVMAKSSYTELA
jgi:hypothetical protein